MILRKGGSSPKLQHAQDTYRTVNEEFRRHNYSRVTSKVIKIRKYSDNKPDIHAVKKKKRIQIKINISSHPCPGTCKNSTNQSDSEQ